MILRNLLLLPGLWLVACSPASEPPAAQPDLVTIAENSWPHGAMVSVANPDAAAAAIAVLEQGGHAVDAAIAAHAVLGLVEPESSGLGGSAFMLVYDRSSDSTIVYDGRFRDLWPLGVAVGVPGTVSLYEAAHSDFGRTDWAALFGPAIKLATDGFEVTEKFVRYNDSLEPALKSGAFPAAAEYLFPGGLAVAAGDLKKNAAYADTLRQVADGGAAAFYRGTIAKDMVARAGMDPMGSPITVEDIAAYKTMEREPVCGSFRGDSICSAPPPSSGLAHIMIPALYDELLSGSETSLDDKLQLFVDAQRLAYADRDNFVGDPAFTEVPVQQLIHPMYIEHRATQRFAPSETPIHGDPEMVLQLDKAAWNHGADTTVEAAGTSHLSIIDGEGNAVSMTASVGFPYGSIRMTNGFFLNNELTDFSRVASTDSQPAANGIAPGKRPRSSMSPTIIFDENGEPLLLTGSAGGSSIIAYSTKTILGALDWGMSAQEAADFPNIVARGETVGIEVSAAGGQAIADELTARGYSVTGGRGENSGLHVIIVGPEGMDGAADSRRHGVVRTIVPK
jgi:gamma-glutamyltranspeptidase/glutathione hydrolase